MHKDHEERKKGRSVLNVMMLVALAITAGRIAMVSSKEGDTAFLSANDRSRWCTVASLVENGTYVIDKQIEITDKKMKNRRPWATIDKVRHLGNDGLQHYYSSKPPLFPTMVAGVYKLVNLVSGMTLTDQPIYVARLILALVNLPLLAIFYWATIDSITRVCRGEWAQTVAGFSTCFGTMLLPFAISLNNHLPAATATAVTMWLYFFAADRSHDSKSGNTEIVPFWIWLVAGVAAAFAAANELPALSMTVFWFLLLAILDRASILPYLLGVAIVAIGFFGTNWLAHESLRPAYMHRGNGELIATLASTAENPDLEIAQEIREVLRQKAGVSAETELIINNSDEDQRWVVEVGQERFALLRNQQSWQLAHWDDWYEYPDSYWKDGKRLGVDRGEPSRLIYTFQMTLGHHGIFSLTPIWFLMPVGLVGGLWFGPLEFRRLAFAVLVATVVCMFFYLSRPLIDRNYGGISICFRWLLWFAPLWLVMIAPLMESFGKTTWRRFILNGMLALSVFSMSMSLSTPWQSPWLYQFWQFLGWIGA